MAKDDGYGRMNIGSRATGGIRMVVAHRVVYQCLIGVVPDGLDLDHTCHNDDLTCLGGPCIHRRCVNPAHLRPATRGENLRSGRGPAGDKSRQTECIHGHAFDEANTYRAANGTRKCRACRNIRRKRYPRYAVASER